MYLEKNVYGIEDHVANAWSPNNIFILREFYEISLSITNYVGFCRVLSAVWRLETIMCWSTSSGCSPGWHGCSCKGSSGIIYALRLCLVCNIRQCNTYNFNLYSCLILLSSFIWSTLLSIWVSWITCMGHDQGIDTRDTHFLIYFIMSSRSCQACLKNSHASLFSFYIFYDACQSAAEGFWICKSFDSGARTFYSREWVTHSDIQGKWKFSVHYHFIRC